MDSNVLSSISIDATPMETAIAFVNKGYKMVAVYGMGGGVCDCGNPGCKSPGKHPIGGDRNFVGVEGEVRRLWSANPNANVGIALRPSGLLDISADNATNLRQFNADGLPPTLAFESGSGPGHEHHLYRLPNGAPITRECHSGQYDLMSDGIAVIPPSVSGRGAYRWLPGRAVLPAGELPEAPAWAVEMLRAARTAPEVERPRDEPPVMLAGRDLDRWHGRVYTEKPDGSIDTSASLYAIAGMLARAGMTATGIEEALRERDLSLGWEKYSTRTDEGYRYYRIAEEVIRKQAEVTITGASTDPDNPFGRVNLSEVFNRPKREWMIGGLIAPASLVLLYGQSGIGKTFATVDLAMRLATGADYYGRVVRPGPFAYFACEDGEGVLQRMGAWLNYHGVPVESAGAYGDVYTIGPNLRSGRDIGPLTAELDKLPSPPALIVVDTLAWSLAGGDENKVQDVQPALDAARLLQRKFGAAVILVHHTGKSGESERGSSAIRAACGTVIRVNDNGGAGRVVLDLEKQRSGAPGEVVRLKLQPMGEPVIEDGVISLDMNGTCVAIRDDGTNNPAEATGLQGNEAKLLRVWADEFMVGEPVSRANLMRAAILPSSTFNRSLKSLVAKGLAEKLGGNRGYRLVEGPAGEEGSTTVPRQYHGTTMVPGTQPVPYQYHHPEGGTGGTGTGTAAGDGPGKQAKRLGEGSARPMPGLPLGGPVDGGATPAAVAPAPIGRRPG